MAPFRSSLEEMILREYQFTRSNSYCVRKRSECTQSPRKSFRRQKSEPSLDPNAVVDDFPRPCRRSFSNEGDRLPERLVSIVHPTERSKFPKKSVSFSTYHVTDCHEFMFDEREYEDFPCVPSYEYLEHDDYYEIMAEMVAELKTGDSSEYHDDDERGGDGDEKLESNHDETETTMSDFDDNKTENRDQTTGVSFAPQANLRMKTSLDSSSESDTLPSSQDEWSDLAIRRGPDQRPHRSKPESPNGPIPKVVIYQSPVVKKERKSSLNALKRSLRLVSL